MTDRDWLASRFEAERPRLRAVAHRMLGSRDEAEDAVQDAWLRLSRSDAEAIDNLGGWLTTVVARLSLDRLRSRRARREDALDVVALDGEGEAGSGHHGSGDVSGDPEDEVLLADSVGLAMLVVLETLSPAERLAFVLHDTFGLAFDEIAPIVDRSPEATRQLASRARRRVRGATPPGAPSPARKWELVDAFLAASQAGDFKALLRILDPDVVARAEGLPAALGSSVETRGAAEVARQALLFRSVAGSARRALVGGAPGFVVFSAGRPFSVLAFGFSGSGDDARIQGIDVVLGRERLAALDLAR